jgi:hypothetical protein
MDSNESPQVPAFCGDVKDTSTQVKSFLNSNLAGIAGTCGDSGRGRPYTRACARTCDAYMNAKHSHMCERGKESPQVPANPGNTKAEAELRCGDSPISVPAESPQVPAVCNQSEAIWVSTDLKVWRPRDPSFIARDCQIDDRCYRRLDPAYFAWLKLRMHAVKAAADAGRVPVQAFDELRQRFNQMQIVAVTMFGEPALVDAVRTINAESYRPPLPDEYESPKPAAPIVPRPNPEAERLARARELVDAIRDQALALGWTLESLCFSDGYERRPFAARYGLVCYIHAQDRIGEVTRQSIELIGPPPLETRSRFYNPDVEQPWVTKALSTTPKRSQRPVVMSP